MRHGSNEPLQHPDEESDHYLGKGINGLKKIQTVDVSTINHAKCGKTPVHGVKAPGIA